MKVPPGEDGGGENQKPEDLIAAEGTKLGGATGFGGFLVETGLDTSVGHAGFSPNPAMYDALHGCLF